LSATVLSRSFLAPSPPQPTGPDHAARPHPRRTSPKGDAPRQRLRARARLCTRRPTLRANPFPKVTDLSCRLPLSTFFYQLEAFHLGDLLRLSVRQRRTLPSLLAPGFSRTVEYTPDLATYRRGYAKDMLCIAQQLDSAQHSLCQIEKTTLPGVPADVSRHSTCRHLLAHLPLCRTY